MAFGEAGCTHQRSVTGSKHPPRERAAAFYGVNTAIANLSTALKATHKTISAKHANDYLGAYCWTTNQRRDMTGMVPALCRAVTPTSQLIPCVDGQLRSRRGMIAAANKVGSQDEGDVTNRRRHSARAFCCKPGSSAAAAKRSAHGRRA